MQNLPVPHCSSVLQPSHAVGPQTCCPQSTVCTAGHEPVPSQFAATVAVPLLHDGARHCAVENVQDLVTTPSQAPLHAEPSPAHAAREPTGLPFTGEHVPPLFGRLQASH
jgi:hypothetical protein